MAKPSMADVAQLAGVSISTVSHVLNNTRFVSKEYREKVYSAIHELGYAPNLYARSFRTGRKNMIGFILPDISNQFFSSVIETVEGVISKSNYRLIIVNTKEDKKRERSHMQYLASGIVDGLILASTMENYSEFSDLLPPQFPTVLIDRKVKNCRFDSVVVSVYDSVYKGVSDFIEHGEIKIGFIAWLGHLSPVQERLKGYLDAMRDHNIPIENGYVQFESSSERNIFTCIHNLVANGCSAVVLSNSVMSNDVYSYFYEHGITINEDIKVLSFVDYELPIWSTTPSAYITQPVNEIGKIAAKQILMRIDNPLMPPKEIILQSSYHNNIY